MADVHIITPVNFDCNSDNCMTICFFAKVTDKKLAPFRSSMCTFQCWRANKWSKWFETTMWDNAERDGRPAEHRWHPLFNAV